MRETHLRTALWREILFIAACAAAAVLCVYHIVRIQVCAAVCEVLEPMVYR